MQLSEQAGALRRMQAVDELLGSSGRIEGLHGLLERVRPQIAPRHQHRQRRELGRRHNARCGVSAEADPGSQGERRPQDAPQAGQHL